MRLTEEAFTAIVDAGCTACGSKVVAVETYVAQTVPLLQGEVYGAKGWGYKGEALVHGTYRLACGDCETELFASAECPRCDAEGGLERALGSENEFPIPTRCEQCSSELLTLSAYVPASVRYEGKRAAKARTQTAPEDEGFHAFRVECKACRNVGEQRTPCPLCSG